MYESFYGLRERPFDLSPNPRYLFLSTRQREALSTLKYALAGPRGLTLLLGEAGTGKTTLVHAALAEVDSEAQCVLMSNPTLTRVEFYEFLASAFMLPDAADSKTRFLFALREHLEERNARGQATAILIDEAQSLPYELLEEVRLLSNIETTTTKLLSVVLAGQPELADRLNEARLRQLKQRIALRCELSMFDLPETAAYMAGRLRIAGGAPAEIFTRNAVEAVFQGSGGIPRLVNVIAHNSLIGGFGAQVRPVSRAIVEDVCRDFDVRAHASTNGDAPTVTDVGPRPVPLEEPAGGVPQAQAQGQGRVFGVFGQKRRFSFF